MTDEELAANHRALGGLIQEVRHRGLSSDMEGKAGAVRDMFRLLMVSDDYPGEWS